MKIQKYFTKTMFLSLFILGNSAQAAFIGGSDIIPSTDLLPATVLPVTFTIDQIADGITSDISPYNGFASDSATGTITLDLVGTYNLTSFKLWNDINVFHEGIADFRLDFYDTVNLFITSSAIFTGPNGQLAQQTYDLGLISGVSSVDLVVLSSNVGVVTRIEIREVGFDGSPVPVPSAALLFSSGLVGLAAIRRRTRKATLS